MEASWTMGFQAPAVNFSSKPMMMTWPPRLPIKQLLIPDLSSVLAHYTLTRRDSKEKHNFNHVRSYLYYLNSPSQELKVGLSEYPRERFCGDCVAALYRSMWTEDWQHYYSSGPFFDDA